MNPEVEQEFLESLEVWAHEWETALQRVLEGQEGELNLVDGKSYRQVKFNPNHDARGRFSSGSGGGLSRYYGDPVLFVDEATPDEVAEIYALPGYELKGVVWGNTSDGQKVFKASLMKDNQEYARMERTFDAETLTVHHENLMVWGQAQGEGLAAALNARAEEQYRQLGFERVTLMADIDVGKYAWARQGYDVADRYRTNFLEDRQGYLRAVLREANPKLSKAAADKQAEKLMKGKTHAWEIAALDDGKKYAWKTNSKSGEGTLGKAVMLKADWWYGEKYLIPGTKSYELGQSYYKAKGVK